MGGVWCWKKRLGSRQPCSRVSRLDRSRTNTQPIYYTLLPFLQYCSSANDVLRNDPLDLEHACGGGIVEVCKLSFNKARKNARLRSHLLSSVGNLMAGLARLVRGPALP